MGVKAAVCLLIVVCFATSSKLQSIQHKQKVHNFLTCRSDSLIGCVAQAPPYLFIGGMFPINIFFVTNDGSTIQTPILPGVQFSKFISMPSFRKHKTNVVHWCGVSQFIIAFQVAVAALNSDPTLLPNTFVNFTFWDTFALPTVSRQTKTKQIEQRILFYIKWKW